PSIRSPQKSADDSGQWNDRWSGEWPGVWMGISRPASVSTDRPGSSPPSEKESTGAPPIRSASGMAPAAWSGCQCVTRIVATASGPTSAATPSTCARDAGPGSLPATRRRPTRYVRVPSRVYADAFGARTERSTAGGACGSATLRHERFGQLVSHELDRRLVLRRERRLLMAVDVDLAENLVTRPDQHHQLRARLRAARQVVLHRRHVRHVLVLRLGDRGAAHALAHRDLRVLRRLANVVVQPEDVLFRIQQVDAHPVEALVRRLDRLHRLPQDRVREVALVPHLLEPLYQLRCIEHVTCHLGS